MLKGLTNTEAEHVRNVIVESFDGADARVRYENEPNYQTQKFEERGSVSVWYDGECVMVITSMVQFDAFIMLVRSYKN